VNKKRGEVIRAEKPKRLLSFAFVTTSLDLKRCFGNNVLQQM